MNPYRIEPPFSVSFSGGESSAFMLSKIHEAYEGQLPSESQIVFANTGLEHEETLKFVKRVSEDLNIQVQWVEYVEKGVFEKVNFETASRNGEPFNRLIAIKEYLPTPVARVCTTNLKIRTINSYLKGLGWDDWEAAVGLRADEPKRANRIKGDIKAENVVCPMYEAGHTLQDVEEYWANQPYRLGIPRWMGNCVGCFLKSRGRLEMIAEHDPNSLEWWANAEEKIAKPFRLDRPSYRNILTQVSIQGRLFEDDGSSLPCGCTD